MAKPRRQFDGPQKVAILKQHLVDKIPVSDLCDQHGLYPNQLYDWLKNSSRTDTPPSPPIARPRPTRPSNTPRTNYRVSAGFGFRIAVPALGPLPIALDFAFPLNRMQGDNTQLFSFYVGLFGGN